MAEGKQFDLQRLSSIRQVVTHLKQSDTLDLAERREEVIKKVAADKAVNEPIDVQETLKEKYLEIKVDDPKLPILIEAVHHKRPTAGEIYHFLNEHHVHPSILPYPVDDIAQIESIIKHIDKKGEVKTEFGKAVESLYRRNEFGTKEIADLIFQLTKSSLILAKQSILETDLNNGAGYRGGGADIKWQRGKLVTQSKEASTNARAALYLAVKEILASGEHLDSDLRLNKPHLWLTIHGKKGSGVAIAGAVESADPTILAWFAKRLDEKFKENNIDERVYIDRKGKYRGMSSLAHFRVGAKKYRQYDPLGVNSNRLQLELPPSLRNIDSREKTAKILAEIALEFP